MTLNDWKVKRSKNPYIPKSWINTKKGLLLEVHYDIGFGKQRNVTVYDYRSQLFSGFRQLLTKYYRDEKEAIDFAKAYMRNN